jgi:hypothetical protein
MGLPGYGNVSIVVKISQQRLNRISVPSGNTMQVFAGHSGSLQCGGFTPDGELERYPLNASHDENWGMKVNGF